MKFNFLQNFPNNKQNQLNEMQILQSIQVLSREGKKIESNYSKTWENGKKIKLQLENKNKRIQKTIHAHAMLSYLLNSLKIITDKSTT